MNAEILAVGTELLLGDIVNTNAQFIARELSAAGINVYYHSVVGDNPIRLSDCLNLALSRSDLIVMTGGLGPTYDDLTKETVAKALDLQLVLHQESLDRIAGFFSRMGRTMTENNKKQAMMPEGATVFTNDWGTAPACGVEKDGKVVVMLPGPPREMQPIFTTHVAPFLTRFSDGIIVSRSVRIIGLGESAVEDRLHDMMLDSTNPTVAPYAKEGEVLLRVTAKAETQEKARSMIDPLVEEIRETFGEYVYGVDVPSLQHVVVEMLRDRDMKLSAAESCTAGLLTKRLTEVPGASDVLDCGVTAYANRIKMELLHVTADTLRRYGAVSEECAVEMATGVRELAGADIGVSITGIAGPDGGTEEKPVGLVHIAVSGGAAVMTKELTVGRGGAEREFVRSIAALNALDLVRRYLLKYES